MIRILVALYLSFVASLAVAENLAIRGETIYTMAGEPISDGVILVQDGRITRVGPADRVRIPDGYREMAAAVITPGFIDARSIVGISGAFNVTADQDHDERSGPVQPQLRALDAYNPRDPLVDYVNSMGVTTLHVGPGRSNPVAGQTVVVKTHGNDLSDVLVREDVAMIFNLGERPKASYGRDNKTPSTRMAIAGLIRQALVDARNYREARAKAKKGKPFKTELTQEALVRVLEGEMLAFFNADRGDDIVTALRIGSEFELRVVLDNVADAHLQLDRIREAEYPVVVHPTMQRPSSLETINTRLDNAARISATGVLMAIQSGTEGYVPKSRVLVWEAAIAHVNGLSFEDSLRAITISPARILGIDDRVGSIERGKDADLVLHNGNPFEYVTRITGVITNGEVSYQREAGDS